MGSAIEDPAVAREKGARPMSVDLSGNLIVRDISVAAVMMVTFSRYDEAVDMCQPAWSTRRTAWAAGSIELGRLTRRFAVHESVRPASVEVQHPISDDLKPTQPIIAASVRVAPS